MSCEVVEMAINFEFVRRFPFDEGSLLGSPVIAIPLVHDCLETSIATYVSFLSDWRYLAQYKLSIEAKGLCVESCLRVTVRNVT